MKNKYIAILILSSLPAFAAETYRGTFIHYEGAEYESTFVPCGSNEILSIEAGPQQRELIAMASANPKLEIPVSLELEVTPLDKTKYPQSHYTGTARVLKILEFTKGEVPCN